MIKKIILIFLVNILDLKLHLLLIKDINHNQDYKILWIDKMKH